MKKVVNSEPKRKEQQKIDLDSYLIFLMRITLFDTM